MLYKLTEDKAYLREGERIINEYLEPLIQSNKFGFLEYDHLGHDSAGACSILIALAEYIQIPEGELTSKVKLLQEKTFYFLMSFRHEHDYFLSKHSENMKNCGIDLVNRYSFLHGFTKGSRQGAYALHMRYEYGYALLRTWQTSKNIQAKTALENYLNYYTFQQYTNPDLPGGYGGVTEHTSMGTYTQDTCHILHTVPLPMIILESVSKE